MVWLSKRYDSVLLRNNRFLLLNGLSVCARQVSPIVAAVRGGHCEVVRMLVEQAGVDATGISLIATARADDCHLQPKPRPGALRWWLPAVEPLSHKHSKL